MSFFMIGGLLCLSKYNETYENTTFTYEPLEEPFKTYRVIDKKFSVKEFYTLNGIIYMDNLPTFSHVGKRRWEVISRREWVYTDDCKILRYEINNRSMVIDRDIDIFTVDHIDKVVHYISNFQNLVSYSLVDGSYTYETLKILLRDIECSGGVCLLYGRDYSIWYKNIKVAQTNGLAVIPFFALKHNKYTLQIYLLIFCTIFLLLFRVCYHPIFPIQNFKDKVGIGTFVVERKA